MKKKNNLLITDEEKENYLKSIDEPLRVRTTHWVIKQIYQDMLKKYKVGDTTQFGVKVTKRFLNTLQKRLYQLSGVKYL